VKKSSVLFIILMGLCLFAKAQLYAGVGGYPSGSAMSTDLTLEIRLREALSTHRFMFGVRAQTASANKAFYTSISLTGDYYFTRPASGFCVFAGGGFGGYNDLRVSNGTANSDNFFNLNNASFGFSPRVGIEAGRFRLSAEYNITGGINNYAAVNLGFFFGGGREK
jgi:hypothetical protein